MLSYLFLIEHGLIPFPDGYQFSTLQYTWLWNVANIIRSPEFWSDYDEFSDLIDALNASILDLAEVECPPSAFGGNPMITLFADSFEVGDGTWTIIHDAAQDHAFYTYNVTTQAVGDEICWRFIAPYTGVYRITPLLVRTSAGAKMQFLLDDSPFTTSSIFYSYSASTAYNYRDFYLEGEITEGEHSFCIRVLDNESFGGNLVNVTSVSVRAMD